MLRGRTLFRFWNISVQTLRQLADRISVMLNGVHAVFHRPHPQKEMKEERWAVRDLLNEAGVRAPDGVQGYLGAVDFDDEDDSFHGRVLGIRDIVTFEGSTVDELRQAFRDSVEVYVEFCSSRGEEPNHPFSGEFILRIRPELHRAICIRAAQQEESLNTWVSERLQGPLTLRLANRTGGHETGNPTNAGKKRRETGGVKVVVTASSPATPLATLVWPTGTHLCRAGW